MMNDPSNDDWTPPNDAPLWKPFEQTVRQLIVKWDVMERAMEEQWGRADPRESIDKLIDDLLANFALRWQKRQATDIEEIVDFLVGTVDDLFDAEMDASVAFPISKVLSTVYEEARVGTSTGLVHILGEDEFQRSLYSLQTQGDAAGSGMTSASASASASSMTSFAGNSTSTSMVQKGASIGYQDGASNNSNGNGNGDGDGDVEMEDEDDNRIADNDNDNDNDNDDDDDEEEGGGDGDVDGWITVKPRNKKRGKKPRRPGNMDSGSSTGVSGLHSSPSSFSTSHHANQPFTSSNNNFYDPLNSQQPSPLSSSSSSSSPSSSSVGRFQASTASFAHSTSTSTNTNTNTNNFQGNGDVDDYME